MRHGLVCIIGSVLVACAAGGSDGSGDQSGGAAANAPPPPASGGGSKPPVGGGPVVAGEFPTNGVISVTVAADLDAAYYGTNGAVYALGHSGAPVAIAKGDLAPQFFAVDADSVYFSDKGGSIKKVAKGGGDPKVLVDQLTDPGDLVVDGGNVYFLTDNGKLGTVPAAGGTWRELARASGSTGRIVVDPSRVYWVARGSAVLDVPKDLQKSVGEDIESVVGDWGAQFGLAVDQAGIYFGDSDGLNPRNSTIKRATKTADGNARADTFAAAQAVPTDVALDSGDLYWTATGGSGSALYRAAASGGSSAPIVPARKTLLTSIAIGGDAIYLVDSTAMSIVRVVKAVKP
jgi:hypothetical protein